MNTACSGERQVHDKARGLSFMSLEVALYYAATATAKLQPPRWPADACSIMDKWECVATTFSTP